jgi:hypothetical protein
VCGVTTTFPSPSLAQRVGNALGLVSCRYTQQILKRGGVVAVIADAMDVRQEFLRLRKSNFKGLIGDPAKAGGFYIESQQTLWVSWNASGTAPDLRILGHEMLHWLTWGVGWEA